MPNRRVGSFGARSSNIMLARYVAFAAAMSSASTSDDPAERNESTYAAAIACAPAAIPPPTPAVAPAAAPPFNASFTSEKVAHSSVASSFSVVAVPAGPRVDPHAEAPARSVIFVVAHEHASLVVTPSVSVTVPAVPPTSAHVTQCPLNRYDRTSPAAHAPAPTGAPSPATARGSFAAAFAAAHAVASPAAAVVGSDPPVVNTAHASCSAEETEFRTPHIWPDLSPRTA